LPNACVGRTDPGVAGASPRALDAGRSLAGL